MNSQLVARLQLLHRILLALYAFVLPVYNEIGTRLLLLLLPLSLVLAGKKLLDKQIISQYRYPLLFIAAIAIGLLYSTNWQATLAFVGEKLSLLIAFLAVALSLRDENDVKKILYWFMAGVALAGVVCLGWAIYRDYTEGAYWAYYHLDFSHIINLHPIYLGYYVNFAIIIAGYYLLGHQEFKINLRSIGAILLICFFVAMHVFLAGRVPLVAIVVSLGFWMVFKGLRSLRYWTIVGLAAVLAVGLIYFMGARTAIVDRFKDLFVPQQQVGDTALGGYVERIMLWKAAINANTNPVFGLGHGDAQPALTEYYRTHNFDPSYIEENYNSHNQYLQTYLGAGVIGLAALLCLIFVPVIQSFRQGNFLAFMFFSGIIFYSMTEVLLARYQGAAFYFLFYPMLYPGLLSREWKKE